LRCELLGLFLGERWRLRVFLENEKISVASVFEAASFVARTEQPTEKRMGKKAKGVRGWTNRKKKRPRKMAEKFPKIT
jgi:hypothetical protein